MSFRNGQSGDSLFNFTDAFFVSRYAANPVTKGDDTRFGTVLTTETDVALRESRRLRFGVRGNYRQYRFLTDDNRYYCGEYTYCSDDDAITILRDDPPRSLSMETFVEILNLFNSRPTLEYRFNGQTFQEVKPFGTVPIIGVKVAW